MDPKTTKVSTIIASAIQIASGIALVVIAIMIFLSTLDQSTNRTALIAGPLLQVLSAALLCSAGALGILSVAYKAPLYYTLHLVSSSCGIIISAAMLYSSALFVSAFADVALVARIQRYYSVMVAFSTLSIIGNLAAMIITAYNNISKLQSLNRINVVQSVPPVGQQMYYGNAGGVPSVNSKA